MGTFDPSGAAGPGLVANLAGPIIVVCIVVALIAAPVCHALGREVLQTVRGFFYGPERTGTEDLEANTKKEEAAARMDGRASDRDRYEFDISVLAAGNPVGGEADQAHDAD